MTMFALKDVTNNLNVFSHNANPRAVIMFLSFNLYFLVIFMRGKHLSDSQGFIPELRNLFLYEQEI